MLMRSMAALSVIGVVTLLPLQLRAQGANVLTNSGFEDQLAGWLTDHGTTRSSDPAARSGGAYLMGATDGSAVSYTYQVAPIAALGVTPTMVDGRTVCVEYGGWQSGWHDQTDQGQINLNFLDAAGAEIGSSSTSWFYSNNTWVHRHGSVSLPAGTRLVRFGFRAQRFQGNNTDAYLDDAYLMTCGLPCGSADYDGDGEPATDFDIEAFFACLAGSCCPNCTSDFNGDTEPSTDADIESFFRVLAGNPC